MFTGIIEETGTVKRLEKEGDNLQVTISASFADELKIDQSIAHNGACLTVIAIEEGSYTVTAIDETLNRTNLHSLKEGDKVNLERCLQVNARLDGHIVQGHVDQVARVDSIEKKEGSRIFRFRHQPGDFFTIEKGSVCVNGVSLTVVESGKDAFSVAVIPYTYEHTNFCRLKKDDEVNIEFDVLGKYVTEYLKREIPKS